jgi:hypothetical protein
MKLFELCLKYPEDPAAKDILLLANDRKRRESQEYETKINEYFDKKTKDDIKVNTENYVNFTIESKIIESTIINTIYELLSSYNVMYSDRYGSIDSELIEKIKSYISFILKKSEPDRDEDIKQLLKFCLDHPNNQLAIDILLLATKKESSERKVEENDEELRTQAKKYEKIIEDARKGTIIVDDENIKENCYLDKEKFKAVYNLLF